MNCCNEVFRLYGVTSHSFVGRQSFYEQIESALKGGLTCLQMREKELEKSEFLKGAKEIGKICAGYGIPLIINDNIQVALECEASGVHLGQQDATVAEARRQLGKDKMIGVSVHSVEEALAAVAQGADYLGVGAIFPTSTKANTQPVSLELLQEICNSIQIPVVAIGGICRENISQLEDCKVAGVAMSSGIFRAWDIEQETREIIRSMIKWKQF